MDISDADARWFLRIEPLMDQTDALGLLVARMAAIGMQEQMAKEETNEGSAANGKMTLAYKITIPQAFVGVYLPADKMPDLKNLGSVPDKMQFVQMRGGALATDTIRFKVKAGKYDVYSKKSAEGLMQKLYRDLSVDNDRPVAAWIEYADEPDFESMEIYEKGTGRKERKKMKNLRSALVERETSRKAAKLAVMLLQTGQAPAHAITPLLNRPAAELADIYTQIEDIAFELEKAQLSENGQIEEMAESVCEESLSWIGTGAGVRAIRDRNDALSLAKRINSIGRKKAEIDRVFLAMAENNMNERRRKVVNTAYWINSGPSMVLSWPVGDSKSSIRLLGQAIQKGRRADLSKWVSDYFKMQAQIQFNPLSPSRIDLAYATLRELNELEKLNVFGSQKTYELYLLCDGYEKMCLRLPLQMERARTDEQSLEALWNELCALMRQRDQLGEKICEIIADLNKPDVQTPNGLSLAQVSARARLALSVLAGEVFASDLKMEGGLMERAKEIWGRDWPAANASAYLGLLEIYNEWNKDLNSLANDKSNKETRKKLDNELKVKLDELKKIAPIDAEAIESDYRKTQSHVSYKSGENRRVRAYISEEMRMRKAIAGVDGHIQNLHNTEHGDRDRRNGPEELRDALSALSARLFESSGNCAEMLREVVKMHCVDEIECDMKMDNLLFPPHLKSLHYASLDVRDLIQDMEQLEAQNYRQSELPFVVRMVVGAHANTNIVPMKLFASEPKTGISFSKYFEFDLAARMGKNQEGEPTPIEEVLYGPKVHAHNFVALNKEHIGGPRDYESMLGYVVLFPKQHYENKLNAEELNDLQVYAQVGRVQALQGKRVFNNGRWEETLPFTISNGIKNEHQPNAKTPKKQKPGPAEALERMHLSHVLQLRMSRMTQNLNSVVNHQTRVMRQRNMQRQAP